MVARCNQPDNFRRLVTYIVGKYREFYRDHLPEVVVELQMVIKVEDTVGTIVRGTNYMAGAQPLPEIQATDFSSIHDNPYIIRILERFLGLFDNQHLFGLSVGYSPRRCLGSVVIN
jgi:hypothetical protein